MYPSLLVGQNEKIVGMVGISNYESTLFLETYCFWNNLILYYYLIT